MAQRDNIQEGLVCVLRSEDVDQAQSLLDEQLQTNWPEMLLSYAEKLNPAHGRMFSRCPLQYHWTAHRTEWASAVMFYDSAYLMCVKHDADENSIKMYDKGLDPVPYAVASHVPRAECTVNNPRWFKVYRPAEGGPEDEKSWRILRRGVADMHRRAEVSQACNERYLKALAEVRSSDPLAESVQTLSQPVRWHGKRVRNLDPWGKDLPLPSVVLRGEYTLHGFRKRDLQPRLFTAAADSQEEKRRRSGKVTRLLRMLRAHGLIKKLSKTRRYTLTDKGRTVLSALAAARNASTAKLLEIAA